MVALACGGSITNDTWLWDVEAKQWIRPRAVPGTEKWLPSPWQSLVEFGSCLMGLVYFAFGVGVVLIVLLLIVKMLKAMWYF